jgi:uncharacterized membrane protein YhaH (DUF805 family)
MRYPLVYGGIAGAIIIVCSALIFAVAQGVHTTSPLLGYLVMLVALSMIFVGVKRYRDVERGGVIRFGKALAVGLGIAAVAALLYVIAWEIMFTFTGDAFLTGYMEVMAQEMRSSGKSPGEIQAAVNEMKSFGETYRNPLVRIPLTLLEIAPVGLVVALVSAAILRNPKVLPARSA